MAGYRAGAKLTSGGHHSGAGNGYESASNNAGNGYRASGNGYRGSHDGHGHGNGYQASGNGYGNGNGYGSGGGNGNGNGGPELRSATAKEQVFEILHVVFKRWRLIAGLFAVVAISGLLAVLSRGPEFLARGTVMITSDRADATIQPTEADSLAELKLNESIVNSEVYVIRSRQLIEQVVRGLALARAGGNVMNIANADDNNGSISERAVRILTRLKVTPVRSSNVIQITFGSGDPSQAAQVVNRIIDEYMAYHAIVHSQQGLTGFYEEQSGTLLQSLRRAEDSLSEYALREGIVSPAEEIRSAVTGIAQMEGELRERTATVAGTEERLRVVREQLAGQPETVKRSQQMEVNPVVRQLREHLTDREVDRVALLQKFTENDRHVRDNQSEIDALARKIDREAGGEPMSVSSETFAANPVYEARLGELLDLEAKLRENRARKLALDEDLDRTRRQLVSLKQRALEFERLDQEVQRQRAAVDLYVKRSQEAQLEEAMDQHKLVNVAVVERPNWPLERTDDRKMPLMLAIISGLAVSFGSAFGLEYLNRTLRFERDVERYLSLPVLGTVADAEK